MSEVNFVGMQTFNMHGDSSHIVSYRFDVQRLDLIRGTFNPVSYSTECRNMPSSWDIKLSYNRESEDDDSYEFSAVLRREDYNDDLKASLYLSFYNSSDDQILNLISENRKEMTRNAALICTIIGISSVKLSGVVRVRATLGIDACHSTPNLMAKTDS